MYAKNITTRDLARVCNDPAIKAAGITANGDIVNTEADRIKFVLKLSRKDSPYQRLSWQFNGSWRRSGASVCYHGHWLFLRVLFDRYPEAIVDSSRFGRVMYTAENFEDEAGEYGNRRLAEDPSNIYYGWTQRDMCNCEEVKKEW